MQLLAHTLIAWPGNVKCQLRAGGFAMHLFFSSYFSSSHMKREYIRFKKRFSRLVSAQVQHQRNPGSMMFPSIVFFSCSGNSKCQHHYHHYHHHHRYHRHHHRYHHYYRRHHHPNIQEMPSVNEGFCWFDPLFPLQPNVGHAPKVLAC